MTDTKKMTYLIIGLLCGLPFAQFFTIPWGFKNLDLWHSQGAFFQLGMLVCFCASLFLAKQEVKVKNFALAGILLWIGVTVFWDFFLYLGKHGKYFYHSLPAFFNFLCMVLFYQICVQYLNKESIRKILICLAYVLLITLGYCVLQYFGRGQFYSTIPHEWMSKFNNPCVFGFIGNPTHLSAYLGSLLPLLFLFSRKTTTVLSIILLFIIILFCTNYGSYTIPITGVITACSTVTYYIFRHSKMYAAILLVLFLIGGIFYYNMQPPEWKEKVFHLQGRSHYWKIYDSKSVNTFITGKGLNVINAIAPTVKEYKNVRHLHNEYLHFLFELGFIGLIAILYGIWDYFRLKVKESKVEIVLRAVFLGFLIQSLTLWPAHIWLSASVMMFVYAGIYVLKNEELIRRKKHGFNIG